ncbi:hypothetical protein HBP85_00660, partial [Staphylococcus aureus]|nr:hypothetical protein [Staphylococcus aureus]
MFAAILFMYYYLLYKSPEYNQRKRFKHFIHITNLIIIAFSTFVLVHLALSSKLIPPLITAFNFHL